MKMLEKDSAKMAKLLMELTMRTYYTFKDETRESGDIAVGSHAFDVLTKIYYSEKQKRHKLFSEWMTYLLLAFQQALYLMQTPP